MEGDGIEGEQVSEQTPQSSQIVGELLRLETNLVPDGVELPADDRVEGAKICVLDIEVFKVKLHDASVDID